MKFILPALLFLAAAVSSQDVNVVLDYSDGLPLCCETHDYLSEATDDVVHQVTSAFEGAGGGAWDLGEVVAGECKTAFPPAWGPEDRESCEDGLTAVWCKKHAAWTLTINGTSTPRDVHGQCHY